MGGATPVGKKELREGGTLYSGRDGTLLDIEERVSSDLDAFVGDKREAGVAPSTDWRFALSVGILSSIDGNG